MFVLLAFIAGGMVVVTIVLNARLSSRIGSINAVTMNYITGVLGALTVFVITGGFKSASLTGVAPYLVVGGGFLGVFVISVNNRLLPKVPVLLFTVLLFFGQLVAGFLVDMYNKVEIPLVHIAGILLVFSGIVFDAWLNPHSVNYE